MSLVYLGLGTNLGDKERNLNAAVMELSLEVGNVVSLSSFYTSEPWGFNSGNVFVNAVVLMETCLSPLQVLSKAQSIEKKLGRMAKSVAGYEDRLIDIDILLYDTQIIDQPSLKIPHPFILKRNFVLIPLTEIAPDLVDPVSGRNFKEFIQQ